MIAHSWDGLRTTQIAHQLGCHPQTVRERLHRFNAEGVDGLGDRPGPGRPRRLTQTDRGRIIALARSQPPGRLVQGGEGLLAPARLQAPAHWTLDALAQAAQAEGIRVGRSQVRRIRHAFIPKRACWRNLQEGWWRLFRREAFARQSFATPKEITLATRVATCRLNARARPWVWGRPPPTPRHRRRVFVYHL